MLIDTHIHLIDPERFPIDPLSGGYIPRDDERGDLADLSALLDSAGVSHGVLVQPSCYAYDNSAILAACRRFPRRFKAVAMARLRQLPALGASGCVAGVRANGADFARDASEDGAALAAAALEQGFILQLHGRPDMVADLISQAPAGRVVIDHLGRPSLSSDADVKKIAALAARDQTYLKVSGGFRLAQDPDWRTPPPAIRRLVRAWPPDRLLWGSDWPFINLPGARPQYRQTIDWGETLVDLKKASQNAAALFGFAEDA